MGAGADDGEPGEGDDVRGDVETIFATELADVLIGNDRDNQFFGSGGQDVLEGRDGNDFLEGRDNPDILRGEEGDDQLRGGPRADDQSGGPGIDEATYDDHFGGPVTVTINNVANDGGGSGVAEPRATTCGRTSRT